MERLAKFRAGDRVEVNRLKYLGTGVITDISVEFNKGMGTKLYPAFFVVLDDGTADWFNGISLTKVD
jgi:hypothetical protein